MFAKLVKSEFYKFLFRVKHLFYTAIIFLSHWSFRFAVTNSCCSCRLVGQIFTNCFSIYSAHVYPSYTKPRVATNCIIRILTWPRCFTDADVSSFHSLAIEYESFNLLLDLYFYFSFLSFSRLIVYAFVNNFVLNHTLSYTTRSL